MPANTFVATAEAASRIGAVPVLVDVDPEHLLDPPRVAAAITPRTRAVVPVHLYGQTAPMKEVLDDRRPARVPVVEDAAQSQGASSNDGRRGRSGGWRHQLLPRQEPRCCRRRGCRDDRRCRRGRVRPDVAAHGSSVKYVHDPSA